MYRQSGPAEAEEYVGEELSVCESGVKSVGRIFLHIVPLLLPV